MTHDVERVLADIDADHGDRCVEFLRHGVLLVLSAPCQLLILAGPEHGRTIPLADHEHVDERASAQSLPRQHKKTADHTALPLALPGKPSIAVLPFENMSGDPEQEYFADGMVEEIITALSRIRWLFVIARNSSFTYKGKAIDIKQVGRELGVRYVLEGSVRKGGGRV